MTHVQKPDFVLRRGRVHLNQRGASVQSTTGSRGVRIGGGNARYTMFWRSVKGSGYPLHSPVFPSLPLPCVTVYHHVSTGVYNPATALLIYLMDHKCTKCNYKAATHIHCAAENVWNVWKIWLEPCSVTEIAWDEEIILWHKLNLSLTYV